MSKALLGLGILLASPTSYAQVTCLGFLPETTVLCEDGGETHKVHGFEELSCGAGRDGILNESVPIYGVDGPTWTNPDETAEISFRMGDGQPVTLRNCVEIWN